MAGEPGAATRPTPPRLPRAAAAPSPVDVARRKRPGALEPEDAPPPPKAARTQAAAVASEAAAVPMLPMPPLFCSKKHDPTTCELIHASQVRFLVCLIFC